MDPSQNNNNPPPSNNVPQENNTINDLGTLTYSNFNVVSKKFFLNFLIFIGCEIR